MDSDCPYFDQIKKLKGEIKRLRQELILKGPSKRQAAADYDSEDDSEGDAIGGLNAEEQAALRMLSPDQRKIFVELENAGANPQYLKRKLKQALAQN